MKPIEILENSFFIFLIILMLLGAHHLITKKSKPKVIKPSGPGTCSVACCIDLIANDKFPAFIPPTDAELERAIKNSRGEK